VLLLLWGPIEGQVLFNSRISEPYTLTALYGSLILGAVHRRSAMLKQRSFLCRSQFHCRECQRRFEAVNPDLLTQANWDRDDGSLWAEAMGFCSKYCFRAYTSYHEYLSSDDLEGDDI